jgi:Ni,Fe-hydrogenase III large subunit
MNATPLFVRNCEAVPVEAVPRFDVGAFCAAVHQQLDAGGRISAYFGCALLHEKRIIAVIAHPLAGTLAVFSCAAGADMPSLSGTFPALHLFEREIGEQFGIRFTGHPWFKPVRFHVPRAPASPIFSTIIGITDFFRVEGDEIHEVAVGPVHAGVIEPGHFRFQCHGENVFHLEISLGYQHRGVEAMCVGGPHGSTRHVMETCAGDSTLAHGITYSQVIESLTGRLPPSRGLALRAVALELERCANHIGDIGALAGDVGFLPTSSYCGRIRGDALNATALLCGSRFGRGMAREGGAGFDADAQRIAELRKAVSNMRSDFVNAADLVLSAPSALARFEGTGVITKQECCALGIVGPVARASGCSLDARQDFPAGMYRVSHIPLVTNSGGDVFARAFVRYGETLHSLDFVREMCDSLPAGEVQLACGPLGKNKFVVSITEGWRGEVCHVAITGNAGTFACYKIIDPSFHNWSGLALALRNEQISDFPLCNKSFNLSYCGHDL